MMSRLKCMMSFLPFVPVWCYLVLAGVCIFFTAPISISPDMGLYMNTALNMYLGKGYVDMDGSFIINRGPVFPALIAFCYSLFGVSSWSAFMVVRLFAIAAPVLMYGLGKKLYSPQVGTLTAVLMLSSYSLCYWAHRHLDVVWPVFVVGAFYAILTSYERNSRWWAVVAGVAMALAFLTKEVSVVYMPLPLLLCLSIKQFRTKENIGALVIYGGVCAALVLVWVGYVHMRGPLINVWGHTAPVISNHVVHPTTSALQELFTGKMAPCVSVTPQQMPFSVDGDRIVYGAGLFLYRLMSSFVIAPLFLFGVWRCLWHAWHKNRADQIVLMMFLCFLPIGYFLIFKPLRVGQELLFLWMIFLVTARYVYEFLDVQRSKGKSVPMPVKESHPFGVVNVVVLGCSALVVLQCFIFFSEDKGLIRFLVPGWPSITVPYDEQRTWPYDYESKKIAAWLTKHVPPGERMLVSNPVEGRAIYFYARGAMTIYDIPLERISPNSKRRFNYTQGDYVIFISSWLSKANMHNYLLFLSVKTMHCMLVRNNIRYVLVGPRRNYLNLYFGCSKKFKKIKSFSQGRFVLYKVRSGPWENGEPLLVDAKVIAFLNELKAIHPERYTRYINRLSHICDVSLLPLAGSVTTGGVVEHTGCRIVREWEIYADN